MRDNFDQEMNARLLQFATGTSGVPAAGAGFICCNVAMEVLMSLQFSMSLIARHKYSQEHTRASIDTTYPTEGNAGQTDDRRYNLCHWRRP